MEIRCDSNDLLHFLVQNGIDEIDAKAIIFDLLSLPEGGLANKIKKDQEEQTRRALLKAKSQRMAKAEVEEEDEFEEDEEIAQVKSKGIVAKTSIRKPKKKTNMSFKEFGGPAQPLR